jgi:transposase
MKTCPNCGHLLVDDGLPVSSPAEELADILIESTGTDRLSDLCPTCREKVGIVNLLGFGS